MLTKEGKRTIIIVVIISLAVFGSIAAGIGIKIVDDRKNKAPKTTNSEKLRQEIIEKLNQQGKLQKVPKKIVKVKQVSRTLNSQNSFENIEFFSKKVI